MGGIGAIVSTPASLEATEPKFDQETEPETPIASATTPYGCKSDGALQPNTTAGDAVMRDRQLTLIGTFDTPQQAKATWQTLQNQLRPDDVASLFGQTLFISTFNTNTQDQVSSVLTEAGATVFTEDRFEDRGTVLKFIAEAPTEEQALQMVVELSNFFILKDIFYEYQFAAPWDSTANFTPEQLSQQANARYTYAQLLQAQEDTYLQQTGPKFFWLQTIVAYFIGNDQWSQSLNQEWLTEHQQIQKEAALQLLGGDDAPIDRETVYLFVAAIDLEIEQTQLGYTNALQFEATQDEAAVTSQRSASDSLNARLADVHDQLATRMGAVSDPARTINEQAVADYWLYGDVIHSGTTVSIDNLVSYQTPETLPAIATYFCEQGFSHIRYSLEADTELWGEDAAY